MTRILHFVLFIMLSQTSFGQDLKTAAWFADPAVPTYSKLYNMPDCDAGTMALAKQDIESDTIYLFMASQKNQVVFPADKAFEQKFQVKFYDFGCSAPSTVCLGIYNQQVFDFLEAKYGKAWRKKIRKDVIGLTEWGENKKPFKLKI